MEILKKNVQFAVVLKQLRRWEFRREASDLSLFITNFIFWGFIFSWIKQ